MPTLPESRKTNTSIQKKTHSSDRNSRYPLILVILMAFGMIGIALWNAIPKPPAPIPTATVPATITSLPTSSGVAGATAVPYEALTQSLAHSLVWIESIPRTSFAPEHGTGVILSSDGLVLTNAHVISYGDVSGEISASQVIGTRLVQRRVDVLGIAPCEDLALLDISGDDYIPIAMNPIPDIGLGTEIFILGYGQSTLSSNVSIGFARGEISRTLVTFSPYQALIEHTAELLPSDSGSPLFNRMGEMIGVNTLMDVQGRGRRASYAISQERIQLALGYLRTQQSPTPNYDLAIEDIVVHRLTDYFDRHCYTMSLNADVPLVVSVTPQETQLFHPILAIYTPQNKLLYEPVLLTADKSYTQIMTIPTDGNYTVVVGRTSTTTTGADKLGDYRLTIRQEN